MSILTAKDVTYTYRTRYQTVHALNGVSCEFELGEMAALVGRSGSGKTTLLSLLAGLDLPDTGEVLYGGSPTAQLDRDKYRRQEVAVVYQAFHLFPLLTALENVTYPMELSGVKGKAAREKARQLLELVGLPQTIAGQFPKMMSGGEQQRVAIARALAAGSRVILADEPTGSLDSDNGRMIVETLQRLAHQEERCVIVVTHDPKVAEAADIRLHMQDGKLSGEEA